jgi:hypothetical protein
MVEKRLALQAEATEQAERAVEEGQTNRIWSFRPLSAFMSFLFRLGKRLFVRGGDGASCRGAAENARSAFEAKGAYPLLNLFKLTAVGLFRDKFLAPYTISTGDYRDAIVPCNDPAGD